MLETNKEALEWFKYQAFEKGISPREFGKCKISDIRNIQAIKTAIDYRAIRESNIRDMVAKMR